MPYAGIRANRPPYSRGRLADTARGEILTGRVVRGLRGFSVLDQLPEGIKKSILGNIGTLICFRLGSQDAQELEHIFSPEFGVEDLQALDKYQVYLKLLIDGLTSRPFSAKTLAPAPAGKREGKRKALIKVSRQRYATRRETIESKINKWLTPAN